jgi:chemotaxis protein CheX
MSPPLISREQLLELVEATWSSMLQLTAVPAGEDHADCDVSGMTVTLPIYGAFGGVVLFFTNERFARLAASRMLQTPEGLVTVLEMQDAAAELCNILAGGVKSLLPRPSSLALPTVWPVAPHAGLLQGTDVAGQLKFLCEGEPLELRVVKQVIPSSDQDASPLVANASS